MWRRLIAFWVLTQIGLVIAGRRGRKNSELEDACRAVAAFVDEKCPSLPLNEAGVHIWQVPLFARHLRRVGSFLLIGSRARSGIPPLPRGVRATPLQPRRAQSRGQGRDRHRRAPGRAFREPCRGNGKLRI